MLGTSQDLETKKQIVYRWLGVVGLIYLLIIAVGMISSGFESAAGERASSLFAFATNPFAGLVVGILATALIQSSSTITSIIVGLVAGGLPVSMAVPMVMGSNIGTTITNTLVSLGHLGKKEEFRSAFAAATIHDFFNLVCVAIFFPLEIMTHFLEKFASYLANFLASSVDLGINNFNPIQALTIPVISFLGKVAEFFPKPFDGIALIIWGVVFIFIAIIFLGNSLKQLMVGQAKQLLRSALGRSSIAGILSGTMITILVQSSSTTTSLIVPLAGTGLLTLEEVYPFTLGANIGTCITALLAAIAVPDNHVAALEIALVHLLFNLLGVVTIYGIPPLRNLPILGANTLAAIASEKKAIALIYIVGVFFLMPVILLGITSVNWSIRF
jgi:sodium-dependent phosphate cotransporter